MTWVQEFLVIGAAIGTPIVALWLWAGWALGVFGTAGPRWIERFMAEQSIAPEQCDQPVYTAVAPPERCAYAKGHEGRCES